MKSRKLLKILLFIGLVVAFLAAGAYGSYRGYRAWRQGRLLDQARTFLEGGELRKAALSLQRAIEINEKDLDAVHLMAVLAEANRSPAALLWRHRAVELKPHSSYERLALAQTAMLFGDLASATNALAGIDPKSRGSATFHSISAGIALGQQRLPEAEAGFREAARLEPDNPIHRLNLSVIRLQGTNTAAVADARASLTALSSSGTNSELRCRALRELVRHSARSSDATSAVALSRDLLKEPDAKFSDRLLYLDVVAGGRPAELAGALAETRIHATNSPLSLAEMMLWQLSKLPPAQTLAWVQSLPPALQTNGSVAMVTADVRVEAKDWAGLQSSLETQDWGELESMRLAYRALALRRQGLNAAAQTEWAKSLKLASAHRGSMVVLLRTVARWQWPNEMREILTTLLGRYPTERWAADLLGSNLWNEGQTRSLLTLLRQQVTVNPSDLSLRNNLAMTALLLEASEVKPHDMAAEVYRASPTNASYASTYAFSLYLQDRAAEALTVIEKLPARALEDPSIAGYYGLILKATGNQPKARHFLDLTAREKVLPEERKLFDRARAGG